jgi:putative transposase
MVEYRTSAHAVFDIKYHFVWITKYGYKILRGRVAERARDLLRQICQARGVVMIRGAVSPDHIHMLVLAPPELAPAKGRRINKLDKSCKFRYRRMDDQIQAPDTQREPLAKGSEYAE